MPRPKKSRRVCCLPLNREFGPLDGAFETEDEVLMSIDEYETIRLIDLQDLTQEECARQMNVARTTVQDMYKTARQKIADAMINAKPLFIDGGDYRLCEDDEPGCPGRDCRRCKCGRDGDPCSYQSA